MEDDVVLVVVKIVMVDDGVRWMMMMVDWEWDSGRRRGDLNLHGPAVNATRLLLQGKIMARSWRRGVKSCMIEVL